jgi:APA family basic amino acid/polyamine antiporter
VRTIGRWSLAALTVNSVLGSGVFGLPSVVAGLVGDKSPLAVLLGGGAIAVVYACYAEVASQFTETGGTYLYVRVAFGRLAGIQVGWFLLLVRLTACAANANLLVVYLGEFWPEATRAVPRLLILTLLLGPLAAVNYRGVREGARLSNAFVVAKLLPLAIVCIAGSWYLMAHHPIPPAGGGFRSHADWMQAMLLLFFAYGGAESALTPTSEAKDPRRDAPFGLLVAMVAITLVYSVVQWVVVGVLPDPGHSVRPLADTARVVLGRGGAAFISMGALVSIYGYLGASMLTVPRSTFALAEQGDFPAWFASVHPRFRTPHHSILAFVALVWLLALFGSFAWNATLSGVGRLLYYGLVCGAVPVLRRRQPEAASFRLPGGPFIPVLGVAICALLLTGVDLSKSLILAATVSVGIFNWWVVEHAR